MGAAVRRARLGQGLSQELLARRSGVDQTTISKLESGTVRMRFTTLLRILEALAIGHIELARVGPPSWFEQFGSTRTSKGRGD
jgi:transcriptional regulator with XRE-family HTH domain